MAAIFFFFPGSIHLGGERAPRRQEGGGMRLCPRERADWPIIIINKMTLFRLLIHSHLFSLYILFLGLVLYQHAALYIFII